MHFYFLAYQILRPHYVPCTSPGVRDLKQTNQSGPCPYGKKVRKMGRIGRGSRKREGEVTGIYWGPKAGEGMTPRN